MEPSEPKPSLRDIFLQALDCSSALEQAAFLDRACASRPDLRLRVEALLSHHRIDEFLERPAVDIGLELSLAASALPAEGPGTVIGHYQLLEKLGEGGCGIVYLADQHAPVRRQVALKIIKLGMDTRSVVARFEAERQTLARMDHGGIARVLDAGSTESGRPYFVMDLVRGRPITEYCDAERLSIAARLAIFVDVCRAVQHAHQKGIIHRDLKPSNVLVTVQDNRPQPKIIDFGIARATSDQPLADQTVFTMLDQFVGTPAYMSPEQAEPGVRDIDTRSDIYSLGVLLYELLTGQTPFDSRALLADGFERLRQAIQHQEPARPSTRVQLLAEDHATTTAERRGIGPPRLVHRLRGDLDWIVMKALEKDRTRRFETADALAVDIERHLRDEPITARPPARIYRLRQLVRRHRWAFAAGTIVVAALVAGLGISAWALVRERHARGRAEQLQVTAEKEAAKSGQISQFLQSMLREAQPSVALGRDTTLLTELVDAAAVRIGQELAEQPEVKADLLVTLGDVYQALGQFSRAQSLLDEALAIRLRIFGEDHLKVAEAQYMSGGAVLYQLQAEKAEAFFRQALAIRKRHLGEAHRLAAEALNALALALRQQKKVAEAEALHLEVLALQKKSSGADHAEIATTLHNLGDLRVSLGNYAEAEPYLRAAAEMLAKLHRGDHPDLTKVRHGLAAVLLKLGRVPEADSMFRNTLAMKRRLYKPNHPELVPTLRNLASLLRTNGAPEEAEAFCREALDITGRGGIFSPTDVDGCRYELACVILERGWAAQEEKPALVPNLAVIPARAREAAELLRDYLKHYARSTDTNDAAAANVRSHLASTMILAVVAEPSLTPAQRDSTLAEAETLLVNAYPVMQASRLRPALKRLAIVNFVRLYIAWDHPEQTRVWEDRLSATKPDP